ncbi:MAG: hypothetical protein V4499_03120 [Pseudomonadota bacterium]|jgi:hypothetical protein
MLHLLPQHEPEARRDYAESVSRLASVRHALRLVDGFAGGPADDLDSDEQVAAAWPRAGVARQRCFDRRSARLVGMAATGIEALLSQRQKNREPHRAASETLVAEIRRELRDVAGIVLA